MAFKDLREFIAELESRGLLKRITTEVDCELEITEITDRVSKMEGAKNVALLFENVKGYDMPVLMNAFGSMERMAIALGVEKLDDVADEMREILKNNLEIRCKELESEGTDILRKNVEIREEHTLSRLSGTLKVRQSIGTWVEIS